MLYLLILVFSAIGSYFLPWWIIAPISFLMCIWKAHSAKNAYLISAAAISTLWIAYATYLNISTGGILAGRVAGIFTGSSFLAKLPGVVFLMILMTLVGANVAGFAGMAGYQLKRLLKL